MPVWFLRYESNSCISDHRDYSPFPQLQSLGVWNQKVHDFYVSCKILSKNHNYSQSIGFCWQQLMCLYFYEERINKKVLLTYKVNTKMITLMWWQSTGGNNSLPASTPFLSPLLTWTTIESSTQVPQQNFTHALLMLPKQTTQTNWRNATTSMHLITQIDL